MKKAAVVYLSVVLASAAPHADRLAHIEELKNTPNLSWTPGLSERFAGEAPGASAPLCGVKGDWKNAILERVAKGEIEPFNSGVPFDEEIPEEFDSAKNWPKCEKIINDIRDQSSCGCCWAFAGAEAASDRMCIATGAETMVPLSAEDVCFCGSNAGCNGGQIDQPWDYIQKSGAVTGGQYNGSGPFGKGMCSDFSLPHCHHHGPQGNDPYPAEGEAGCPHESSPRCPSRCDADASDEHRDFAGDKYTYKGQLQTASGVRDVQKMIMTGGPVETAFTVYSDFENYVGGIYHYVSGRVTGGHAVKIVGWGSENGVKYWKVANSWNPYWGEDGYFRVRFGDRGPCSFPIWQCQSVEDQVVGAAHDAKWGKMHAFDNSIVV